MKYHIEIIHRATRTIEGYLPQECHNEKEAIELAKGLNESQKNSAYIYYAVPNSDIHPDTSLNRRSKAVPVITQGGGLDSSVLSCPFCSSELVHPAEVEIFPIAGKFNWKVTSSNLVLSNIEKEKLERSAVANNYKRGITISVRLFCEEGAHVWDMLLEFYKGHTYVIIKNIGLGGSDWDEIIGKTLDTLWRS